MINEGIPEAAASFTANNDYMWVWGLFGGIITELTGLFKIRTILATSCPKYLKSFGYWIITILMAIAGAILVMAYMGSGFQFKPILAINVGATAPLIFEALLRKTPEVSPGSID